MPVCIEHDPALAVIKHLRLADNCNAPRLLSGRRFIDQGNAFDNPVFVNIARPITASLNFFVQSLCPFELADIDDSLAFPEALEVFATKVFVKSGVLHLVLAEELEGLLQEVSSVSGGVRVAWPKRRVQIQAGLAFKGQQRMIAFTPGLVRVCPLGRAGLIAGVVDFP